MLGLVVLLFAGCAAVLVAVSGGETASNAATDPPAATAPSEPSEEPAPETTSETPTQEPAPPTQTTPEEASPEETTPPTEAPADEEEAAAGSVSQENALESAQRYLGFTSFSRDGLITQLEFDGFNPGGGRLRRGRGGALGPDLCELLRVAMVVTALLKVADLADRVRALEQARADRDAAIREAIAAGATHR